MVFCCNRLEEIGNYKKVRRIKDVASVHGDKKDTCGGKWKIKDLLDQGGDQDKTIGQIDTVTQNNFF